MLSLITINFNNCAGLQRTIRSVQAQETNYIFEHILIDGASTDQSLVTLKEYVEVVDNAIFLSEKDSGIYNAMNKGLALASGSHIAFLNSGDILYDDSVLNDICKALQLDKSTDLLYGDVCFIDEQGSITRTWSAGNFKRSKLYYGWMPPHPMTTIRADILHNSIGFDEKFKIAADYDLMLTLLLQSKLLVKYLPKTLVKMELGGVSYGSLWGILKSNLEVLKSWMKNKSYLAPYWIFLTKPLSKIFQIKRWKLK